MKFQNIPHRMVTSFKIIWKITNFWAYFADVLHKRGGQTVYRLRDGTKLISRNGTVDHWVMTEIFVNEEYTKGYYSIQPLDNVVDIGANIGVFSVFAATRHNNVKVYCCEPLDANFALLQKNIRLNKLQRRIIPAHLGLGSSNRRQSIYINDVNFGATSLLYPTGKRETVRIQRVADFFNSIRLKQIDLLKIDCEGAEYEIVRSIPAEHWRRIKNIVMEWHEVEGESVNSLIRVIRKNGFDVQAKGKLLFAARRSTSRRLP